MRGVLTLFLFAIFVFLSMGCNATLSGHVKTTEEIHVDGVDVYIDTDTEFDTKEKKIKNKVTCSFQAVKDGVLYSCEDILFENLNADFRFETDCKVVIDKDTETGLDTVLMDFKNSECSEQSTPAVASKTQTINKIEPVDPYTVKTGKAILPYRKKGASYIKFDEPQDHG